MVLLLALISAASAPASFKLQGVPHVRQKPDFCGEACVEMALKYQRREGTQDDVFRWSKVPPALNRGAWTKELKVAAETAGFEPGPTWYPISAAAAEQAMRTNLDDALNELRAGTPSILCMRFSTKPDAPEHFRLLIGYEKNGDTLLFEDPAVEDSPTRISRRDLFEMWPLKYDAKTWTLVRLKLEPAKDPYPAHVARAKARYGEALDDLLYRVEPPFVVWGDRANGIPDTRTVKWTIRQLETEYFAKQPDGIYDVFLFDGEASYVRHAKQMFGEEPGTPYGYASSQHHALVMNIATGGGTLVHEMVHPYLAANFTNPPTWLNEGLASLYEQSSERDGRIIGLPNWRLAGLQRALEANRVKPISRLVSTTDAQFRSDEEEGLNYAHARYLMQYLQEQNLLHTFVHKALEQQQQDPTAATALKETLGEKRWRTLDATFRQWVLTLRF